MSDPLVTIDQVLQRLGLGVSLKAEMTPTLNAAVSSAQVRLETELDTKLSSGSGDELFCLNSDSFSGIQPDGMFRLILTNGFVLPTGVVLTVMDRLTDTVLEGPLSAGYDYAVNQDLGIVYVEDRHRDKYIRVHYSSGFLDADDVQERHPWVGEALLAYVPLVLNSGRAPEGGESAATSNWRLQGELAQGLVARYNRKMGFTFRSIVSSWKADL